MIKILLSKVKILGVLIFLFCAGINYAKGITNDAAIPENASREANAGHKKSFRPGDMIIEHILDAHEWHILTWDEFHLSVPLPVILVDKGHLVTFSSARFHHGHESYLGYKILEEGPDKGKIVKVLADGHTVDTSSGKPIDLSITKNVLSLFMSLILMCIIFISIANRYKKDSLRAPKGLQSLLEPLILFVRDDIAVPTIGEKRYNRYMPYLLTVFFFIFFNNLFGLIPIFPGGANLTGNIAITMSLALFTFTITSFSGNKDYWKHIVDTPGVPWWLKLPIPLMPIVETIGLISKPFVLTIRLFANITAGHIIVLTFISLIFIFGNIQPAVGYVSTLISVPFAIFMTFLELLVAFIQAYVFTLLSAIYFGMATEEHHHEVSEGIEEAH